MHRVLQLRWGLRIKGWRRSSRRPMLAVMRDVMPAVTKPYSITDELAGAVDAALARLCKRDQQMGDIIWLYYGAKWPMARVGKHYGISEGKARELARAGTAWIDCYLSRIQEAC
ncbi:antitermination protein Q [Pseudomonas sp. TE50-2]|uniref:antitermination protein Q n=1 Tax=Pseudomonas sp. TE50-2 TaxID=3142707 RepID=UPI003467DD78